MKDEDLDRCPRCKEDMWAEQKLCRSCQHEDELEEWPGGEGYPFDDDDQDRLPPPDEIECDICGHVSTDPEGRHHCCED
ncbi:hypothetical protein ACSDQ5_001952 [Cronobacter sakazakii]